MKILITGASGGLGQKLAEDSFARGHEIFLTDINEKALNAFASKWKGEKIELLLRNWISVRLPIGKR